MDLQNNVNELITLRTNGVEDAMKSMKDIESLFDRVTSNYRPLLNGERYLLPYFKLGGKVLYRESDLEALLQRCYHPVILKTAQCDSRR